MEFIKGVFYGPKSFQHGLSPNMDWTKEPHHLKNILVHHNGPRSMVQDVI